MSEIFDLYDPALIAVGEFDRTQNEDYAMLVDRGLEESIEVFNNDVGKGGFVGARGRMLRALMEIFLESDLDCSDFICNMESEGGVRYKRMSCTKRVRIEDDRIIQIEGD